MIWAYLVHIGFNMWREENGPVRAEFTNASPILRFDKEMWDEILVFMKESGLNTVVMDLGEGIKYESHPEIAAEGAWSISQLKSEIKKMKEMGITPIPKLNFFASHDEWLGDYSRCVSSQLYYQVCSDLIKEVCQVFENPPLFHLGMDEERDSYGQYWGYSVTRHGDFWWKDLYFFFDVLEKCGVRPWIWSDYAWNRPNEFRAKMPKHVMLSNWYYGEFYDIRELEGTVSFYDKLDKWGYEQIPCGMNINILRTVKYCMDRVSKESLKGFLQTSWKPTILRRRYQHLGCIDLLRQAKEGYYGNDEMFDNWVPFQRPSGYDKDYVSLPDVDF